MSSVIFTIQCHIVESMPLTLQVTFMMQESKKITILSATI